MSNKNETTMPKEAREEWNDENVEISFGKTYVDYQTWQEFVPGEYSMKLAGDVIIIPAESNDKSKENDKDVSYTAAMENMSAYDTQK